MATTVDIEPYLHALTLARHSLPREDMGWLRALRERAITRFTEDGFPTIRDERWKYTDVAPILRQAFTPALRQPGVLTQQSLDASVWNIDAHRVVFVNGYYAPELSAIDAVQSGVSVGGLAAALADRPDALEPYLGRIAPVSHGFAALNAAFLIDGAYVHVPRGIAIERPIHLVFIAVGAESLLIQPRNLVVAESGSRATVIEHYFALGEERYFTNAVTELYTAADADIEHYRVQQQNAKAFHIGGVHARQERDSRFTSYAIDLGGLLVRNDLCSTLNATGARCALNGLYVADGRSHIDNHTEIDHAKPDGTSREFYKGVLSGRARAVFNGRVVVRPDAQRTDAQQMNNNLLLSEDAEVDTKPELEIYADDVKCSHGATVGQLDEDALFYLRTRALDESTARDLLTFAFVHDVLSRMRLASIRQQLERRLTPRLFGGRALKEMELL